MRGNGMDRGDPRPSAQTLAEAAPEWIGNGASLADAHTRRRATLDNSQPMTA